MNIFPYPIVRISGISFLSLARNKSEYEQLSDIITRYIKVSRECDKLVSSICDLIFVEVQNQHSLEEKRKLINFKRDYYNRKVNIDKEKNRKIINSLPQDIQTKIFYVNKLTEELSEVSEIIRLKYETAIAADIRLAKEFVNNDKFKESVFLSSIDMMGIIDDFDSHLNSSSLIGVLKYATRMATKTSPFSKFTHLTVGKLNSDKSTISLNGTFLVNSHVRYNNYLLNNIVSLFRRTPTILSNCYLLLNSTIQLVDGYITFFTNYNNIEAIQKIKSTPLIQKVVSSLSGKEVITFNVLLDHLCKMVDSDRVSVQQYLTELIQTGLIIIQSSIAFNSIDWESKLSSFVKQDLRILDESFITELETRIAKLTEYRKEYELGTYDKKVLILKCMQDNFNQLFSLIDRYQLHSTMNDIFTQQSFLRLESDTSKLNTLLLHQQNSFLFINARNMIYEDSTINTGISYNEEEYKSVVRSLDKLVSAFSLIASTNEEANELFAFFIAKYGCDAHTPVLKLYEEYYQYKSNVSNSDKLSNSISDFKRSFEKRRGAYINAINNIVHSQILSGSIYLSDGELKIPDSLVLELSKRFRKIHKPVNKSNTAFVQLHVKDEVLNGVVNIIAPGHGKYLSRFLHLFKDEVTAELSSCNKIIFKDELVAENCDSSIFNANIHPQLTEFEIEVPNCVNKVEPVNRIDISKVLVKLHHSNRELEFVYDNQKLNILDLGFQAIVSRSKLYQTLSMLSNNRYFNLKVVSNIFNEYYGERVKLVSNNDPIYRYPRIRFLDNLIIQRKNWIISSEFLIGLINAKDENNIFFSVNYIKSKLKLPDEIFIRVFIDSPINDVTDNYKPQYINFLSPLLVKLFYKIVKGASSNIQIEEIYPLMDHAIKINGEPFVTETIIQW